MNEVMNKSHELKENIVIYAKWEKIPEVKVPDTYLSVNNILIIFKY